MGFTFFLLDVACLNFMQNVGARKCGKMIIHYFWFKTISLADEIRHCCHCFQIWFWKWNELFKYIMCTRERMCLKEILAEFWCFIVVFKIYFCWCFLEVFPTIFSSCCLFILYIFNVLIFFEYSKLIILDCYVVFKCNFSPHTNVWNPTFLLPSWKCWMHVST